MEANKDNEETIKKYEEQARTQKEKLELRQKNLNVDRSSVDFKDKNSKLDLVNKFKNKLKDFASKYDQIMKDLDKLNLTRYVLEISKILCELSIPQKDILVFLRFTSRMHQEYEEFSSGLQGDLLKQIKQGSEGNDEQNKANRRRNLARFAFELYLIGLPVTFEKTFKQIKEILDDDNEDIFYANMNLAVTFVQNFNEEFIGTVARSKKKDYAQNPDLPKIERLTELVSNEKKKIVLNYLKSYLERMINHQKSYNKRLQELEDARKQALLNLGKVDEETESKYTDLTKKYTTTFERIQIMCDHLDIDPPKQEDEDTIRFEGEQMSKRADKKEEEPPKETDQFENEQEFAFYGNLIDLRDFVPDALLSKKYLNQQQSQSQQHNQQSQAQAVTGVSPAKDKEDGENGGEQANKEEKPEEIVKRKESEEHKLADAKDLRETNIHPDLAVPANEVAPTAPKSYEELISRLEVCESRDYADDFAKDFCYINNAPNRKRLIKDICAYHKDYQILVPLYCRILATLNRYYRDVGEYLLEYLQKEYKYIKDKAEKERRLRIILYFCEATKFRLIPPNHTMDCLQECLNSPTGINIDVIILILERTGVFLYNNSSKNDRLRFEMQLTQVNNFRTTAHLPDYTLIQLENAYYICKPPERAEIKVKKHLTDLENYILYLLFERLEDNKVAVELAKLPFLEVEDFVVKCFMKIVRKGRYGHMNRAAALVNYLGNYYPSFTVKIIDTALEEIIVGFEENVFTERQKRISFIKFFGELYNYTAIEIDMIFKILYFMLEAGNDQTNVHYRHITDSKEDIFRISLICTLLETVAPHLKKKKYKNAVDKFLVFFQRYILTKAYIPINVEFHVLDVLDTLSPDLKKFKTYKEAHEACMKLSKIKEEEVEESKDFNELRVRLDEEKGLKSEEELERERKIKFSKQEKQFDAEFQELMQSSIQENISSAEVSKPVKLIREKVEEDHTDKDAQETSNKEKKITLCLRQGNKLVSKNIYLDKKIDLAKKISKKEEEEKETREKAMEATKSLHDSDVKKSNLDSYEGYVSNSQIRVIPNKKQYK